MDKLLDLKTWRDLVADGLLELATTIAGFLPNLLGALLLLVLGLILARALELVTAKALATVGFDRAASRLRISELLERAEIRLTFSRIVARLLFWMVMLAFILSSVETLNITAVSGTLDRLIAFIPRIIGAVLIALGGLLLGRITATVTSSAAAAAGFVSAARLGFVAQVVVASLVLVVAVEQLGVTTHVLVLPLTVGFGCAGLAIGLAFALGARPVVSHIMAGHFLKQSLPRRVSIEVDGQRGIVERVGAVDTLLRSDERTWTVPNARLLEQVVVR